MAATTSTSTRTKTTKKKTSGKGKAAPRISTYSAAIKHLMAQPHIERMRVVAYDENTFKLGRMRALLAAMGNPHQEIETVHVAGTVGKGSTVAMLANMLGGCGYTVGQFTSPHLVDLRERVRINDELVSEDRFTALIREVAAAAFRRRLKPTFFELMTAAALQHFANEAVDIALIETGLGGRLDATNVITPILSLITRIDLDHTHVLGDNVEDIAREKAGILKPNVPSISVPQTGSVIAAIRTTAEEQGTTVKVIGKDIEFSSRFGVGGNTQPSTRICLISGGTQYMHVPVPLKGEHQADNCALAMAAMAALSELGFDIPEASIYESLAATTMEGRMELVWKRPRILVDGAHNPVALKTLVRCIGAHIPYDSMICVFGCCQDKDVDAMLQEIALGADKIIFTRTTENPRAADPLDLQRRFSKISSKMSQVVRTLPEAIEVAARGVGREDLICVTGSFYLVGETKSHLATVAAKNT